MNAAAMRLGLGDDEVAVLPTKGDSRWGFGGVALDAGEGARAARIFTGKNQYDYMWDAGRAAGNLRSGDRASALNSAC